MLTHEANQPEVQSPVFTRLDQEMAFETLDTLYGGMTLADLNLHKLVLYQMAFRSLIQPDESVDFDHALALSEEVECMCETLDALYGIFHDPEAE